MSKRGFAAMELEKRREIARKGGHAAQATGKAHRFTPEEAREAGRKGGLVHSREHLSNIGRIGGHKRGKRSETTAFREEGDAPEILELESA